MTTHDVATGRRCAHLRAKTPALWKNALGSLLVRVVWWQAASSATTARPRPWAWTQMWGCRDETRAPDRIAAAISGNDQQQLVERGDFGGQVWAVEEIMAAMDNPGDPVNGESRRIGARLAPAVARCVDVPRIRLHLSRRAYPVGAGDSERTELACGVLELMKKSPIPTEGKVNILVVTHEEFVLGPLDSDIHAGARARAALDESHFVWRAGLNARRREEMDVYEVVIRHANDERQWERRKRDCQICHGFDPFGILLATSTQLTQRINKDRSNTSSGRVEVCAAGGTCRAATLSVGNKIEKYVWTGPILFSVIQV